MDGRWGVREEGKKQTKRKREEVEKKGQGFALLVNE
jgi:hypothetical protein